MSERLDVTLQSGDVSDDGAALAVDLESDGVGLRRVASLTVSISSIATSVVVGVETSCDGTNWRVVDQWSFDTFPVFAPYFVAGLDRYVRATWELEGDATIAVQCVAEQSYATIEQLFAFGLPERAWSMISRDVLWGALVAATGEARSYVAKGASGTIVSVGSTLAQAVSQMAALDLVTFQVGVDSEARAIELLVNRVESARAWLKDIGRGIADSGAVFEDDSEDEGSSGGASGFGESDAVRDWSALAP